MTIVFEQRIEYHYFAADRLSEAHVRMTNDAWEWATYVYRSAKYQPRSIAACGSGRSASADAAMLAAQMWLEECLPGRTRERPQR